MLTIYLENFFYIRLDMLVVSLSIANTSLPSVNGSFSNILLLIVAYPMLMLTELMVTPAYLMLMLAYPLYGQQRK